MIFLGFLIFAVLFILSVAISIAYFFVFVDLTSLLFVLLGLTGYILLFGRKEFARGIKTFFAFSFSPDEEAGRFFQRLASFTVRWGLFGMLLGLTITLMDLDPDKMGKGIALSLLSILYTSGLAGFVFLPIGLRLSPTEIHPSSWKMRENLSLIGLAVFVLLVGIRALADLGNIGTDTFFSLGFEVIGLYLDMPSLIAVAGSWWAFRLASGERRQWIAVPMIILIGAFWSTTGLVMMLCNLDPDTFGAGAAVCLLTTLYAFIAAAGFLIADMRRSHRAP